MTKISDLETVERALTVLALSGGNGREAERRLKEMGIKISYATLYEWKDRHAVRYQQIQDERAPQIEETIIRELRETAVMASRVALKGLEAAEKEIEAGDSKDAAASARNAATVAGIATDKLLVLSGRPTQITESRTSEDLWSKLDAVTSTAVELSDSEAEDVPRLTQARTANAPELNPA